MTAVDRVKQICKERSIPISKLEKDLGFSNGYIGQLKKGTLPDNRLRAIAEYFDVAVDFFLYGYGKDMKVKDSYSHGGYDIIDRLSRYELGTIINIYGHVAAGEPLEANGDIIGTVEVTPEMLKRGELFALKIKGD